MKKALRFTALMLSLLMAFSSLDCALAAIAEGMQEMTVCEVTEAFFEEEPVQIPEEEALQETEPVPEEEPLPEPDGDEIVDELPVEPLEEFIEEEIAEEAAPEEATEPALEETVTVEESMDSADLAVLSIPLLGDEKAIEGMLPDKTELILGEEEVQAIGVSFTDGLDHEVIYASEDSAIAAVDEGGRVTGVARGETAILITGDEGSQARIPVIVKSAPSCVRALKSKIYIGIGETLDVPVALGEEGEDCAGSYTVKASPSKYLSVSKGTRIKGRRWGKATVTVKTHNGESCKLTVYVRNKPSKVSLNKKELTLGIDESFQLTAKLPSSSASKITYSSNNEAVANVSESGEVIAYSCGTAEITAETFNGKKAICTVHVMNAPENISFGDAPDALGIGQSFTPTVTLNAGSAGSYSFSTDRPDLLDVDPQTGETKALASAGITDEATGEIIYEIATVIATTYNGVPAELPIVVKKAPSCVAFAVKSISLGKGERIPVPGIILGAEGEDCVGSYSLKSSSTSIATIADGEILGRKAGSTTITVKTHNNKSAKLSVKVYDAPSKVSLNKTEITLGVKEHFQLTSKLPSKTASKITYSSNNEAVANVSESGEVIAYGCGTAEITAETFNGKKAICTVHVMNAPESISMSSSLSVLGVNETAQLSAVLNAGSAGSFHYESLNPEIAVIEEGDQVKGIAEGTAVLKVIAYNEVFDTCEVTVKPEPKSVTLQESSLVISIGDTYQLAKPQISPDDAACSTFKYKSSSKKARVSADGLITGVSEGSATITLTLYNGKKDTLKVSVKKKPGSISFAEKLAEVFVGVKYKPVVNFSNKAVGNYSLVSSDAGIVAIGEDGRSVIAVAPGTATITATSFNEKTAEMQIYVPPLPDSVLMQPGSITLGEGDSEALEVSMPEGQGSLLTFESSDAAVATVSENGLVRAEQAGEATITVRTMNDLFSETEVCVLKAPTRVQLSPRRAARNIDEGGIQLETGFGSAEEGGRIRYFSSDEAIATVSDTGYVCFHGVGDVRITAETYNGRRGYSDIQIGEQPGEMIFAAESFSVALGDTIEIPVLFDKGCESYSLSVSDSAVAEASGNRVTGLSLGSVTLTATSISGLTASCVLNVVAAPEGLTLDVDSLEMIILTTPDYQLKPTVLPGGVGSVYFTSSDPDVASVDYVTGEVHPEGVGECTITAATYDGMHSALCAVKVRNLLDGARIGIDPGHQRTPNYSTERMHPTRSGRKKKVSSGTRGKATGVAEYVVNLQIGLKLREELEYYGAEVYMTRETHDVNISNQQRAKMMNALGVDMVLRIHCNGSSSSGAHGMSSYVRKTGVGKAESKAISKLLLKYMSKYTGAKNLGVKYSDDYTGNNWSTVPCMMLELGYMTNRTEDRKLVSGEYQDKLVRGMVSGIAEYMGRGNPYE